MQAFAYGDEVVDGITLSADLNKFLAVLEQRLLEQSLQLKFTPDPEQRAKWESIAAGNEAEAVGALLTISIGGTRDERPTANAGTAQSIRAGDTVVLSGSGSFDDNTAQHGCRSQVAMFAAQQRHAEKVLTVSCRPDYQKPPVFLGI